MLCVLRDFVILWVSSLYCFANTTILKLNMEKGKNLVRKELSLLKVTIRVWETTNTQTITSSKTNDYREIEWKKQKQNGIAGEVPPYTDQQKNSWGDAWIHRWIRPPHGPMKYKCMLFYHYGSWGRGLGSRKASLSPRPPGIHYRPFQGGTFIVVFKLIVTSM